jgi:hypothetical protein
MHKKLFTITDTAGIVHTVTGNIFIAMDSAKAISLATGDWVTLCRPATGRTRQILHKNAFIS